MLSHGIRNYKFYAGLAWFALRSATQGSSTIVNLYDQVEVVKLNLRTKD